MAFKEGNEMFHQVDLETGTTLSQPRKSVIVDDAQQTENNIGLGPQLVTDLSRERNITHPSSSASPVRKEKYRFEDHKLGCFDPSSCIIIHHIEQGRSGNRIQQLRSVENILSKCSGAAISPTNVQDNVARFPPLEIFGNRSCTPSWKRLPDMEYILSTLASACEHRQFDSSDKYTDLKCSSREAGIFHKISATKHFPRWLDIDLEAWRVPLTKETAVLHFRGSDIFGTNAHEKYTQPVCDHYIKSFHHSQATCALLFSEDSSNPCLSFVKQRLNCTRTIEPCSATCAFTLLSRAKILVASFSTFVFMAASMYSHQGRRQYFSYCTCTTDNDFDISSSLDLVCTDTDRNELFPWKASPRQVELLQIREVTLQQCEFKTGGRDEEYDSESD
jgi:hypothetical protein